MDDYQKLLFGCDDNDIYKNSNFDNKDFDDCIDKLKDWFKKESHLPAVELEDRILTRILHSNSFNLEKCKIKIDNLYTAKTLAPELFRNRDPCSPEIRLISSTYFWAPMPKLSSERQRIYITGFHDGDPSYYDPAVALKLGFMISELRMFYEASFDDVYVWDCTHIKMGHVKKILPSVCKKAFFVVQNCYCAKIKAIHIVNLPAFGMTIVNLIKSILKKKIADRIILHPNTESLHKHVPKDLLPEELHGTAESYKVISDRILKVLQSSVWRDRIIKSGHEKSDESKRQSDKIGEFSELMGTCGSFRKIDVD